MLRYLIVEISGKQYKVIPGKDFLVDSLGEVKNLESEKVLLKAEDEKITIGTPYLKEKVVFDVLASIREKKIRVFKYHAKANTRKIRGSRRKVSKIILQAI